MRRAVARLRMPLFWRVFAANGSLLLAGTLVLVLTPVTVSSHVTLTEAGVLVGALGLMLVANLFLLRPLFGPLERLAARMKNVDLLREGRAPVTATGEVRALEQAFNEMIERLERERRESGARALRAQEAERLRIASGLHDEVGQTMTGVLLQLKRAAAELPEDRRAVLAEAQDAVRASLDEVRRIARELRPEALEELGLASALTELATSFARRTGIRVDRRVDRELPPLEPEVELALYRVAQESLTNAARHAEATEVTLTLAPANGSVVLRVLDNGRGFANGGSEGSGLRGIRERALMIGGALAIKPGSAGGVEVRLEVPARGRD